MANKSSGASLDLGFSGLLGIAFIVLKLTKVVSWSWFVVLMPIWIPIAVVLAIIGIALVVHLMAG